jgi:hypothetical protein
MSAVGVHEPGRRSIRVSPTGGTATHAMVFAKQTKLFCSRRTESSERAETVSIASRAARRSPCANRKLLESSASRASLCLAVADFQCVIGMCDEPAQPPEAGVTERTRFEVSEDSLERGA